MARPTKALPTPADDGFNPARLEEADQAARQLAPLQAAYSEERDLANQLWGQIQMADAIAKFTTVVGLTKLKEIKETKLYRAFAGKSALDRDGNKIPDVGTWEGFCRALGTSSNKVDEDLLNLRTFGGVAMENLSRIGAGYRELRQYRRLPEDQKLALIEVARSGDKEAFLEIAEDIIAKHAKEKEASAKEIADLQADLAAEKVIRQRNSERINRQEEELARLTATPKQEKTPALLEAEALSFMNDHVMRVVAEIEAGLRSHFVKLERLFGDEPLPNHVRLAQQQALAQVIQAARVLAGGFGVTLKLEDNEPQELLWLTQAEALFGDGRNAALAPPDDSLRDIAGEEE